MAGEGGRPARRNVDFFLQWHVTADCDQKCMHCYMHESEFYKRERENELSLEDCRKVIDDLVEFTDGMGVRRMINFSGGDPLLRDDFFGIVRYARERNIRMGILGNPNHLDDAMAKRLKESGISDYQVSIDGMRETHDRLRGREGLFDMTVNSIDTINRSGMTSHVMTTVSKANEKELEYIIDLVAEKRVGIFAFARLVPTGNGEQMRDQMFTPQEYRNVLERADSAYRKYEDAGCRTRFARKDHLFELYYAEEGLAEPPPDDGLLYGGCSIFTNGMSILADGTVFACRRLPVQVGKVPEQKVGDIFIKSRNINKMRRYKEVEGCGTCEIVQVCRGCPSVTYATTGNYFAKDPQCWKPEGKIRRKNEVKT